MEIRNKCKLHPRYQGKHRPRQPKDKRKKPCAECLEYYHALRQPGAVSPSGLSYPQAFVHAVKTGRRAFETPEDLVKAGVEYFIWCDLNEFVPTKTGFAAFNGLAAETVGKYRRGEKDQDEVQPSFSAVLKRIDTVIIANVEEKVLKARHAATGLIAWMNNAGGWSSGSGKDINLGLQINLTKFGDGAEYVGNVKEITGLDPTVSGDPPAPITVDVEAERIEED